MSYCYFLLDQVPATMPHKLWFAVMSEDQSTIAWTDQAPGASNPSAPWLVGVDAQAGTATVLATFLDGGIKDVPPPPTLQASTVATKGFRTAFEESFEATIAKSFVP